MELSRHKLIIFDSVHHSIKSEKVLTAEKIEYQIAAVPPEISADCGAAVTVKADLNQIIKIFRNNHILVEAIYEIIKNDGNKNYKKIYKAK